MISGSWWNGVTPTAANGRRFHVDALPSRWNALHRRSASRRRSSNNSPVKPRNSTSWTKSSRPHDPTRNGDQVHGISIPPLCCPLRHTGQWRPGVELKTRGALMEGCCRAAGKRRGGCGCGRGRGLKPGVKRVSGGGREAELAGLAAEERRRKRAGEKAKGMGRKRGWKATGLRRAGSTPDGKDVRRDHTLTSGSIPLRASILSNPLVI